MAGFLDPKERVIDMVLTDVGKSLLLKGELQFVYWIPFDDEVDYNPYVSESGSLSASALQARKDELTESPLVREATMGYRGLNFREEDTTNVNRPMFSAPPGVGQSFALPELSVDPTGTTVEIKQRSVKRYFGGLLNSDAVQIIGIRRYDPAQVRVQASYSAGSYPADTQTEGFLVTVYQSSTIRVDELGQDVGGFQEIIHNFDSSGSIVYLNDLTLKNVTP